MTNVELEIFEQIDFADEPVAEDELLSCLAHLNPDDVFEGLLLFWSLDIIDRDCNEDGVRTYYVRRENADSEQEKYLAAVGAAHDR